MFGLEAKAFEEQSDFVDHSRRVFHHVPTIRSIIWSIFPLLNKISPNRSVSAEFNDWFIALYVMAVKLRVENNIKRDDYLNFLMELQKKKNSSVTLSAASIISLITLTKFEIRSIHVFLLDAFTFFLDGFETTSYMLGNAINELAKNKECQEKLRSEVKSFKYIGFDDFNQMPYLDAVVNGNAFIVKPILPTHRVYTGKTFFYLKKQHEFPHFLFQFGKRVLKMLN